MFKFKTITAFLLCCGLLGACTRPAATDQEEDGAQSKTRVTFSASEDDISVYTFESADQGYLFTNSVHGGWTRTGESFTLKADVGPGDYSFLFATGYGDKLTLDAPTPATTTQDIKFVLQDKGDGSYGSCDEVFIVTKQWDSSQSKTIKATLKRAVSRIDLNLNRGFYNEGYSETSDYEPVAYSSGNITELFQSIEMTVTGVGNELVPYGNNSGWVTLVYNPAASDAELTDEGFARYESPYFIPTANEFSIDIKLIPVAGGGNPQLVKSFSGLKLSANQKLTLNLWLNHLYPTIGVTAETSPIEDLRDGDSGLWN